MKQTQREKTRSMFFPKHDCRGLDDSESLSIQRTLRVYIRGWQTAEDQFRFVQKNGDL